LDEAAFGDVRLDFKRQTAVKAGREVHLTSREFAVLRLLIGRGGEVVGRDTLLNEVWGYEKFPTTRTVDTFIHNLRRKLEDDPARPAHLLTVPWSGYKFQK
jgi:DNA-binding response OmpR family regulator